MCLETRNLSFTSAFTLIVETFLCDQIMKWDQMLCCYLSYKYIKTAFSLH